MRTLVLARPWSDWPAMFRVAIKNLIDWIAPMGYEDECGFHEGKEPDEVNCV